MTEDLIKLLADLFDEEDPIVDENLELYLKQCEEYTDTLRCKAMLESVYELLPAGDAENRDKIMWHISQQNVSLKYFGGRVVRVAAALYRNAYRRNQLIPRAARRHFHKGNISCADLYAQNITSYFATTRELKEWLKETVEDRMYDRQSGMSAYRSFGGTFLSTAIMYAAQKRPNSIKFSKRYFAAAVKCFEEAVAITRSLAKMDKDSGFFPQTLVEVMAELAGAHLEKNDRAAAEKYFLEAIDITRKMFENEDHYYYLPDLVSLLKDLAGLYREMGREMKPPDDTERIFTETLEFYEGFAAAHRWEHRPLLGRLMSLFADFYRVDKPERERSISLAAEAVVLIESTKDADRLAAKGRAIEILKEWEIPDDELEVLLKEIWQKRNPDPEEPCPELRQWLAAEPLAEDFAGLLYRLPEHGALAPKDQKNLDTYLGRCPEYIVMRGHFDRLNAVINSLPSRSDFYYVEKIAEEVRRLEFGMENFRLHVLEIAKRLNGGSPGSLTHSEEARAYFENYQVLEAGVYSFAFFSDEDVLTTTLESHLRRRDERELELADFLGEIARVFLRTAEARSGSGLVEEAVKYFNTARLADPGVTEGVVLPGREIPADDTPAPTPPKPAEPVEDFVSLLGHLNTAPSLTPADHANFNHYLENCWEYTKMQRDVARLNSIFPHLKVPDDKEKRYQVMVNANDLNSQIKEFKERVLKAAQWIAAGDENDPATRRAFECFNSFALEEAEYFAFPEDWGMTDQSFEEMEKEWGRYVDDIFRWGPPYDRMGSFFRTLANDFFDLAFEKTPSTDAAVLEDAERYYNASICAEEFMQSQMAYGILLQNTRRFGEASDKLRYVLDTFGDGMNDSDRLAVLDVLGTIEADNDMYERARETLFSHVELLRKLMPDHAPVHRPALGKTLNRLGRTLLRLKELEAAKEYLLEALEINRGLIKFDPYNFEPQVMEGLGDLAQLHAVDKDFDAIEKYFLEAIELARKLAAEEKSFRTRLGFFLAALAAAHEQMLDLDAAEREYNETESIYRDLAGEEPEVYELSLAQRAVMVAGFLQQHRHEPVERERSIWLAAEAFVIAVAYDDDDSAINIALNAKEILEKWDLDPDEIGHRISFQEAIVNARKKRGSS